MIMIELLGRIHIFVLYLLLTHSSLTHTALSLSPLTHTHTHTLPLTEYRDAFALFDKRGDTKIDSDQIGDVLRALNLNPSEAEVKKIIQEIDPNGKLVNPVCVYTFVCLQSSVGQPAFYILTTYTDIWPVCVWKILAISFYCNSTRTNLLISSPLLSPLPTSPPLPSPLSQVVSE